MSSSSARKQEKSDLIQSCLLAGVVFLIGCLFLDLVPLQQPMTCKNYQNTTTCPESFFSLSYQDAREKFLEAAEAASAQIESHLVLRRGNVEYYTDTAFFPGKNSKTLLVHASGTHGIEGYTGSAIQTKLLREWNETFQAGSSVLFVHAVNPFGMAHYRRFNENNVDLNRNYLSAEQWEVAKSRDPDCGGYEELRSLLSPAAAPRLVDRYWFFYSASVAIWQHGFAKLKRAFVTGQYHHPEGVYYGGDKEQPSVTILRALLKKHSEGVEDAVFIDVHTGLGPHGVDTIMCSTAEEALRAEKIFAGWHVQNDKGSKHGPSGGYDLAMGIIRPIPELGPRTLAVTEEFGTVNSIFVARSIVLENAAYNHCRGSYVHEVMKTWVRDAFYPQEMAYKTSTLTRGSNAFWAAQKSLSSI